MYAGDIMTVNVNLAGLPALVLPCGFVDSSSAALPVGIQMIGAAFEEGRDLSPVTDKLWKRFYKIQFGEKSINQVVQDMKLRNGTFKWKQLYEAKLEELEETQQKLFKRIGQYLYLKEDGTARLQYQKNFGKRNHKKKTEVKLGTGQLSVCRRPSSLLQHQEIN
uniref:Uncharacterized protein isoform X2 n=1 Tax=Nicotiana tabacum TaxID=4097 RepID=A0A1S4D0J0_TOBAC|nr:PREDICTED: uncharacterized protein LOC107824664 isoform X2 [Nicotiana tabacum]